ncbi:tyrosine-type recombinase/integrase [Micromonospora sp. NBC_00860]|uniref:tyrosine-type recombinase/integrase n=1 Tax=Micromonospora sp. NBC_00860 TaxID=2975980 RepID=UPI00386437E3
MATVATPYGNNPLRSYGGRLSADRLGRGGDAARVARAGPWPAGNAGPRGRRGSGSRAVRSAVAQRREAPLTLEGRPRPLRAASPPRPAVTRPTTRRCDGRRTPAGCRPNSWLPTPCRRAAALRASRCPRQPPGARRDGRRATAAAAGTRPGGRRVRPAAGRLDLALGVVRVIRVAEEVSGHVSIKPIQSRRRVGGRYRSHHRGTGAHRARKRLPNRRAAARLHHGNRRGDPARHLPKSSLKPSLQRAGLPVALRFHDLRHSYATRLVSDGVPINDVARVMGHEQTSTTLNRYTHSTAERDRRVLKSFAAFSLPPGND